MSGLSTDTQALMAFEANKKSAGISYVLWFFTGAFGGHRFYLGRSGSAISMLLLNVFGWLLILAAGAGLILLAALGVWLLVDLFLIPGMVAGHNGELMARLNATAVPKVDTAAEIAKFAALREQGTITDEEFEAQKAKLLG